MTFAQVIRFANDSATIEKMLRLLQALSQILAAWSVWPEDVSYWMGLRGKFTLGRRYIRFFNFLSHFSKAYTAFQTTPMGFTQLLTLGKWTFMGGYLGLESLTILDVLGVWPAQWAQTCTLQGNRFWFYALICSILLGLTSLFFPEPKKDIPASKRKVKDESRDEKMKPEKDTRMKNRGVQRKLLADCADILIPGHITGWVPTSSVVVGWATAISSLLGLMEIWERMR